MAEDRGASSVALVASSSCGAGGQIWEEGSGTPAGFERRRQPEKKIVFKAAKFSFLCCSDLRNKTAQEKRIFKSKQSWLYFTSFAKNFKSAQICLLPAQLQTRHVVCSQCGSWKKKFQILRSINFGL